MSAYGCPDQSFNDWTQSNLNITFDTEFTHQVQKSSTSPGHHDLLYVGPFGLHSFQLNFCVKRTASRNESDREQIMSTTAEWPPGDYAIFGMTDECPVGRYLFTLSMIADNNNKSSSNNKLPLLLLLMIINNNNTIINPGPIGPGYALLFKQCRFRSVGF